MRQRLKPLALSLLLLGVVTAPAFAETDSQGAAATEQNGTQTVDASQAAKPKHHAAHKHAKHVHNAAGSMQDTSTDTAAPKTANEYLASSIAFPIDADVPGKSFVSTGPYIGVPLVYSGGDLIINNPSVNQDVALLNIRKSIRKKLIALGRAEEADHAHLLLSGIVEGVAAYHKPDKGADSTDINLSSAELDGYVLGPSNWTSGLFSFSYDDSNGVSEGSFNNNARTQNSRLYLNKAFVTIGDFSQTPFYGSIGQMYVPFGTYGSNMISSPFTKTLGRTKARAIVVGYQQQSQDAFYASGYAFRGDSHVGAVSRVSNGGINFGYRYKAPGHDINGDVGAGVIVNLADSFGMQNNGNSAPQFGGFGANGNGNEMIAHRVAALDLRGQFSVGDHIDLLVEYIGALSSFSKNDLTMNSHGAKPMAVNAEGAYTFSVFDKPSSVAIGYGKTKDALALELPAQRYVAVYNMSIWKDTLESLEFRHDIDYAASSTATGTSTNVTTPINGTSHSDNALVAQIDIYF